MRLLVCGDRNWTHRAFLFLMLDREHENQPVSVLIEGEAPGADTLSRQWAESRGVPVEPYPAEWRKFGRAAGPIRNKQMLDEGQPDAVVAFHPALSESKGTRNMVSQAMKRDIPVTVYTGREAV